MLLALIKDIRVWAGAVVVCLLITTLLLYGCYSSPSIYYMYPILISYVLTLLSSGLFIGRLFVGGWLNSNPLDFMGMPMGMPMAVDTYQQPQQYQQPYPQYQPYPQQ